MEIRKGVPVSPGIAIGPAFVLDSEEAEIPQRRIDDHEVPSEVARFERAIQDSIRDIRAQREKAAEKIDQKYLGIFDFHIGWLEDETFCGEVVDRIKQDRSTAEFAAVRVLRTYIIKFQDNEFLSQRVGDIYDIRKKLLANLLGIKRRELDQIDHPVTIIARDLTPSQTVGFDRQRVLGFATDAGGRTSHTAIMARALGIPAVVALDTVTADVCGGDHVIIDGNTGVVIIAPDEAALERYRGLAAQFRLFESTLSELRDVPAETKDGMRVSLFGNIEFPEEIPAALERGAEGIGLYRTEYLYTQTKHEPTESEHFEAYRKAAQALDSRPITIRTFDLGADKLAEETGAAKESNPFLGCRSIRLCFERGDFFRTQIRAILRASDYGTVKILFPMITALEELKRAKRLVEDVKEELRRKNVPFDEGIQIGIMIEVPSAALVADILAKEVDFFSIGTNDLIQYALAIDRANERVAKLYQPAHPAILRLVKDVIDRGNNEGVEVAMCGEMSGDLTYVLLLLGMGLKEFSVAPAVIPEIKKLVRTVSMSDARALAQMALSMNDTVKTLAYLEKTTREILPEAFEERKAR